MKFPKLDNVKADSQPEWEQIAARSIAQFLRDTPSEVAEIIVARRVAILEGELARIVQLCNSEARGALKEFDEALRNTAAVTHLFPHWMEVAEQRADIRLRDIPEADAIAIRTPRLQALKREFIEILDSDNGRPATQAEVTAAATAALDRFDRDLLACAVKYHADAQRAATDQRIESRRNELTRCGWNVIEVEHICGMLAPGEKLQTVAVFHVETNRSRCVSRDEVRAWGRPLSWTNDSTWQSQFTPNAVLRELEADLAEAKRAAARPPWADNLNRDLGPRGIRA